MTFSRSPSRLAALLAFALAAPVTAQEPVEASAAGKAIPVLLISGANNHDWEFTAPSLKKILEESGRFDVTLTTEPGKTLADAAALAKYRAFVLDYNGPSWGEQANENFVAAVRGGTGVAVVHASNNPFPGWKEFEEMVALLWRKGTGHGRFHPFTVKVTDRDHPLTRDMPDMRNHPDELYHRLVNAQNTTFRVLATAHSSKESGGTGNDEPMILVKTYGEGRIFHTPLGHVWRKQLNTHASHADPQFRQLIARGTEWAATGAVTLPAQAPNFLTAEEKEQGFRLLFNGRDFDGWRGYRKDGPPQKGWSVQGGALVHANRGGGGDLMTTEQYGNFDFRFEWRVAPRANSGIIYRIKEIDGPSYKTGPEYQVIDDVGTRSGPKHSSGALYDLVAPPAGKPVKPVGQWNTGRIVISKGRVKHWVNGMQVVDSPFTGDEWRAMISKSKFRDWTEFGVQPKGHIALQDHGNEVAYRSLRIRELDE